MHRAPPWFMRAIVSTLAALLTACAGVPRDPSLPIDDPNEAFNRKVFAFNQAILHPPATVVKALPALAFDRLRNVDNNLKEPRILGNDILQGRMNAAGITFARFLFNSTFGLGGLFDVATPEACRSRPAISARPCSYGACRPAPTLCGLISVHRTNATRSAGLSTSSAIRSAGRSRFSDGGRASRPAVWMRSCVLAS